MGIFDKGTNKTNRGFFERLSRAIVGKTRIDDGILDAMEEALVETDMGVETTLKLIDALEERVSRDRYVKLEELTAMLQDEISKLLDVDGARNDGRIIDQSRKPYVILVVGVNGVGKTTTIGKLASKLVSEGKKVVLGAADTFRAAAGDQLKEWANRAGVDMVGGAEGADPGAVVYDAVAASKARNADVLLVDTAGRLHNKKNLMNELGKINKILESEYPDAYRETLVVLDATTGQNALVQAREFSDVAKISGIVLTKMDGTAKGGIAVAIQSELSVPVKYIGVGETIDDLQKFDSDEFVNALFDTKTE